ncbi:apolipoprotein N-acyltransferase [Jatrophihabitans sp.]|uniref:apolipoprotein N-acyltransferase n=1 Tax=Jatrophihabitans sp. TaxID=1932789 RepID=UPI0030C7560C|nr:Apolipoprotein N-acyltransferase [Jatrophihabitans sp.]
MLTRPAPVAEQPPAVRRVRVSAAVALVSGILLAGAFPRIGIWPLALLSVGGLSWAVDGRRSRTGAWLGFVYGLGFFVPLLHWTGIYVGPVPWLLLATAEAGFMAALGAVLPVLQRLRGAPVWIACAWVLQEALRDRLPFGGFPWGRLAFSQADSPLRWFIALGGAPLLTFVVALAGATLLPVVAAALARDWPRAAVRFAVPVAVVVAGLLAMFPVNGFAPSGHPGPALHIALVQGSVPDRGLAFEDRAGQVLANHIAQTRKLAEEVAAGTTPQPDLVIWPENSSDLDPYLDAPVAAEISAVVKEINAPVLVGAILQGPGADHRRNAGILWSPTTGPGATYIKRHPVPFAEYLPLRSIATRVSSAAKLVTQDMVAGHGNGLLQGGPAPIGDVICFEVAYDDLVRSSVSAGAQLLVVQTNNATFGHTSETYQQLAMSKLRAVEHGRSVLQVSTTGASAVINAKGEVVTESHALFEPAILTSAVQPVTGLTIADELGDWPEYVLSLLALAALGWAIVRSRRDHEPAAPDEMVHR